MSKKFLVGSRYFFGQYPDFKSKDTDYLYLIEKGKGFASIRHVANGAVCSFEVVKKPAAEMLDYALHRGDPMQVGKFLVKEFAEEIGMETSDLQRLAPVMERLDDKHAYLKPIFAAIIEGQSFDIPEPVREVAYRLYKEARNI